MLFQFLLRYCKMMSCTCKRKTLNWKQLSHIQWNKIRSFRLIYSCTVKTRPQRMRKGETKLCKEKIIIRQRYNGLLESPPFLVMEAWFLANSEVLLLHGGKYISVCSIICAKINTRCFNDLYFMKWVRYFCLLELIIQESHVMECSRQLSSGCQNLILFLYNICYLKFAIR